MKFLNINLKRYILKIIIFFILSLFLLLELQALFPVKIEAITLRELSGQVAALSDEEEALLEEIVSVEATIDTTKNEITVLTQDISNIENDLRDLTMERNSIQKSINEKRNELEKRVIFSYKYGRDNVVKMLTTARNINDFITAVYFLRNIMKRDKALIESLRLDKETYDRNMRKSEEKKSELESTKRERQTGQKKLEENLAKDQYLLDKVKGEKSNVQQTLAAIRERISRIQPEGVTLSGEWTMVATAYFSGGGGLNGDGVTATGLRARLGVVAVDPSVIRLGTKLYIEGYGQALAADTGGWIKGNRIDLCFESLEECLRYGRRKIYVYLVED